MTKRAVSFETYCKRNINYAVQKLSSDVAKEIKRAFEATNCSDIYGGDLATYISVIAQVLERRNEEIAELKKYTEEYIKEISGVVGRMRKRPHLR